MKTILLKYALPGLVLFLVGMFGGEWLLPQPKRPECPACNCPPSQVISLARSGFEDVEELKKIKVRGDLDMSIDIQGGPFFIITCDDTLGPFSAEQTRRVLPIDELQPITP